MRFLFLISILLTSALAHAEYGFTYVDVYGREMVSISLRTGGVLDANDVILNGSRVEIVSYRIVNEEQLRLLTADGEFVISIPPTVKRSPWRHQREGWFTNGDTRVLDGEMIIGGQAVNRLVEIYSAD